MLYLRWYNYTVVYFLESLRSIVLYLFACESLCQYEESKISPEISRERRPVFGNTDSIAGL